MWDLPGPGIEPMSPGWAGRFFTTEPSGLLPGSGMQLSTLCPSGLCASAWSLSHPAFLPHSIFYPVFFIPENPHYLLWRKKFPQAPTQDKGSLSSSHAEKHLSSQEVPTAPWQVTIPIWASEGSTPRGQQLQEKPADIAKLWYIQQACNHPPALRPAWLCIWTPASGASGSLTGVRKEIPHWQLCPSSALRKTPELP